MKQARFTYDGRTFIRIDRREARRRFNSGLPVLFLEEMATCELMLPHARIWDAEGDGRLASCKDYDDFDETAWGFKDGFVFKTGPIWFWKEVRPCKA